jgi:cytochrome c553
MAHLARIFVSTGKIQVLKMEASVNPLVLIACLTLAAQPPTATPADPSAGMSKSAVCQACHGGDGISVSNDIPNLAGQKREYLSNQLKAFKSGERKHDVMNPIARQLSDADIGDLAAFWNSLPSAGSGHEAGAAALLARKSTMSFPAEFPKGFTPYRTDEDKESGRVTTYHANAAAVAAARADKPLPSGAVIVVATSRAKRDENEKILTDAAGHLVADAPAYYSAMEARAGAGKDFPDLLRNGDWIYGLFNAQGVRNDSPNYALCLGCHKGVAGDSYVFTMKQLRDKAKSL